MVLKNLIDPAVEAFDHAVGLRGLRRAQAVLDAMLTQATIQTRVRDMQVQELPHYRHQVVERNQQRFSQRHRHGLIAFLDRRPHLGRRRCLLACGDVSAWPHPRPEYPSAPILP